MIKLFASDLDGTLFNAFHSTDRTILSAIRRVIDAGAHFAIATGRTMRSTRDFGFEGIPVDIVSSNGSIVRDGRNRVVKTFPLDPAALEELLCAFPDVCFECVTPEATYITGTREERQATFSRDGVLRRIAMRGMRSREREDPTLRYGQRPSEILAHGICKINCRVPDAGLKRELGAYLAERRDVFVNAPFNPAMFEITSTGVDKGSSLAWLAASRGIAEDEVAVYGDGGNDIVMLERFGHAYATSNGTDDAKRAAGTVIGSCLFHAVPRHMVRTVRAERGGA